MLPAMQGQITRGLKPSWEPLVSLVGREVVGCFSWKFAAELDDGTAVHAYRNIGTGRYLILSADGRAFEYREDDSYDEVEAGAALRAAFHGWEEARPRPRDPDAVRALLARHEPAEA
jgi:hypothetical protein